MTEKITRAQAEAAMREIDAASQELDEIAEWTGDPRVHPLCAFTAHRAEIVRAYLAQQPSDDVVRKAHEALDTMHEKWCNCCSECQTEGGPLAEAILAALPPMPEEK